MQADVDKMKAHIAKVTDAARHARWQSNVDLWGPDGEPHGTRGPGDEFGRSWGGPGMMHRGGRGTPPPSPNQ